MFTNNMMKLFGTRDDTTDVVVPQERDSPVVASHGETLSTRGVSYRVQASVSGRFPAHRFRRTLLTDDSPSNPSSPREWSVAERTIAHGVDREQRKTQEFVADVRSSLQQRDWITTRLSLVFLRLPWNSPTGASWTNWVSNRTKWRTEASWKGNCSTSQKNESYNTDDPKIALRISIMELCLIMPGIFDTSFFKYSKPLSMNAMAVVAFTVSEIVFAASEG